MTLIVHRNEVPRVVTSAKRARVYVRAPLVERFWLKVNKDGPVPPHRQELGPCWIWTGAADDRGYGQIQEGGRRGRRLKAHRVSFALHNGPLEDSVFVCHHCDNPSCVRDSHLFTGSAADNSQDAAAKGRLVFQMHPERCPRGERASGAKLTAEQVHEIRRLRGTLTQAKLAARFGVTQANISAILLGQTWRGEVRASATLFEEG